MTITSNKIITKIITSWVGVASRPPTQLAGRLRRPPAAGRLRRPLDKKLTKKSKNRPLNFEVLHEKLKTVLPMVILKFRISTPNFTKF